MSKRVLACFICREKGLRHTFLYCSVCESPICPKPCYEQCSANFTRSPCCSSLNVLMLKPYLKQIFDCPGCNFKARDEATLVEHIYTKDCLETRSIKLRRNALTREITRLQSRVKLAKNAVALALEPLHKFEPPGPLTFVTCNKLIFRVEVEYTAVRHEPVRDESPRRESARRELQHRESAGQHSAKRDNPRRDSSKRDNSRRASSRHTARLILSYHGFKTAKPFSVRACVSYLCDDEFSTAKLLLADFTPGVNSTCVDEDVPHNATQIAVNASPFL